MDGSKDGRILKYVAKTCKIKIKKPNVAGRLWLIGSYFTQNVITSATQHDAVHYTPQECLFKWFQLCP